MYYDGTTFTMKMKSNDEVVCDNFVFKQNINVLKRPYKIDWSRSSPITLTSSFIWVIEVSPFSISAVFEVSSFCVFVNLQLKLIQLGLLKQL